MKKIISKILIIFIIIVMLFEFICTNNISLAMPTPNEETLNKVTNLAGGIVSIVYWPKRITAVALAFIFDIITANVGEMSGINFGKEGVFSIITPFDIFFNKYKILDINFFDIEGAEKDTITYTFRTTVSGWYYVMRLVASGILLVILIYVGIRMALSTVADEKAKYKKMLYDWACSLVLIFALQYIALFVIYSNNAIVEALRTTLSNSTVEESVGDMMVDIGLKAITGVGIPSMVAVIVFVLMVWYTVSFLIAYINRMIKVGFLIIISPLISLTYSIDKMGDGKAQALGNWLKEFAFTILIQPFHCIMYLAFIRTAFELIVGNHDLTIFETLIEKGESIPELFMSGEFNQLVNGALAILCLKFVKDGEAIVRKIFGFQDDNSSTSFAAGMAVGMIAVKNAKKIGGSARKGVNFAKNKASTIGKAISRDSSRLANNNLINSKNPKLQVLGKVGKGVGKAGQFVEKKAKGISKGSKDLKGKFNDSLVGKKISGAKTKYGKFKESKAGEFISKHNSLAGTLGLIGATMAYGSGAGALEAYGMGAAMEDGSREYFNTSDGNLAASEVKSDLKEDEKDYKELEKNISDTEKVLKEKEAESTPEYNKAKRLYDNRRSAKEKYEALDKDMKDPKITGEKLDETEKAWKKAKKDLESAEKEIAKLDDNSEEDKKVKEIIAIMAGKDNLEKEKKDFYSEESIRKRINQRRGGAKNSELQAKKNAIIQKLTELKLKNRSGNNSQSNELSVEETDSIERTASFLIDNITHGVMTGQGFNSDKQEKLIEQSLGLNSDKDINYEEIFRATSDFESLKFNQQKAEAYSYQASYGGDNERLVQKEVAMVMDRYRAQGKYKSSERSS